MYRPWARQLPFIHIHGIIVEVVIIAKLLISCHVPHSVSGTYFLSCFELLGQVVYIITTLHLKTLKPKVEVRTNHLPCGENIFMLKGH